MPRISTLAERESDYRTNAQALSVVKESQRTLRNIIETMRFDMEKRDFRRIKHGVMLRGALAAIEKTKTYVDMAVASLPTRHTQPRDEHSWLPTRPKPPPQRRKAAEVFSIPELAEKILLNLEVGDLLCAQQVNWTMFNVIGDSVLLQQNMLLKPRPSGPFGIFHPKDLVKSDSAPYWSNREGGGLMLLREVRLSMMDTQLEGGRVKLDLAILSSKYLAEKVVGASVASMLICQPPIHVMNVTMACCKDFRHDVGGIATFVLKAPEGITIGHLVEVTKKLHAEHRMCPFASPLMLNEDGIVDEIWPRFKTKLTLERDDPMAVRAIESHEKMLKLWYYSNEKSMAYRHDRPIPTLAEFEAQGKETRGKSAAGPSS